MPVIDAHQHFWDLERNYLPWLSDEPQISFRYGDYSAIRRNYLPTDYRRDTAALSLAGSVFVETEWDRRDPVGETRWVHDLAAREGLPTVMVCHAALNAPDADAVLARQSAFPLVRGVRHKPTAAPAPDAMEPGAPGSMSDPDWRRGYAQLAAHGFSFDLQTPWWHLTEAAQLNADFPETLIVLNHTGLPSDRSANGLSGWRAAMTQFAAAPNVAVKISGLGEPGTPWSLARNRDIIRQTIDIFGAERCMFASNYPVDSLVGGLGTIFDGFAAATDDLGHSVQAALFAGNARRFYRIEAGVAA
ncbi:amidohydrolase family protein [Phenylobacterium deserti]|uniref:amidohydrolase family protein n=1 Tax=Phenylobacterium deserti TaxID=1914756 RepID=UPI00197B0A63|nr:amidohydrolase family protein [Phenylobacterium deserti]